MRIVRKQVEKEFEPFEIVITVSSEGDFGTLEALFRHLSAHNLNETIKGSTKTPPFLELTVISNFITGFYKALKKETSK